MYLTNQQSFEEDEVSSYRSRTKLSNRKVSDDELYEEYEDETDDQDQDKEEFKTPKQNAE